MSDEDFLTLSTALVTFIAITRLNINFYPYFVRKRALIDGTAKSRF